MVITFCGLAIDASVGNGGGNKKVPQIKTKFLKYISKIISKISKIISKISTIPGIF